MKPKEVTRNEVIEYIIGKMCPREFEYHHAYLCYQDELELKGYRILRHLDLKEDRQLIDLEYCFGQQRYISQGVGKNNKQAIKEAIESMNKKISTIK